MNGVDYTFVSMEEFGALEKSGNLLESGQFGGEWLWVMLLDMGLVCCKEVKMGKKRTQGAISSCEILRVLYMYNKRGDFNKNRRVTPNFSTIHDVNCKLRVWLVRTKQGQLPINLLYILLLCFELFPTFTSFLVCIPRNL